MKQVTIRRVSDRGVAKAREIAKERGVPLNTVYAEALEAGLGLKGKPPANGLQVFAADSNFGPGWQDYLTRDLNRIDPEIWR